MKTLLLRALFLILVIIAASCGQRSHEHDHDHGAGDTVAASGNQALYDQVMAVHDEVMPKLNDIYKLKEELKNQITEALPQDEKEEIEATIAKLDSASESMMVWMRNFNPLPDSLGEEQAKEYLENEMEKIKKVREEVREALEKADDTD